MPDIRKIGDLELDQDLDFTKGEWKLTKYGSIVLGVILLAALLGVFGRGPVSYAEMNDPSGAYKVEYERFERHDAGSELVFHLQDLQPEGNEIKLYINKDYINKIEINSISPEPFRTEIKGDNFVYVFRINDLKVFSVLTFNFDIRDAGSLTAVTHFGNTSPITFNQFVYP